MNRLTTHSVLKNAAAVVLALSGIAASGACSSAGHATRHAGTINVDEVGTISVPNHSIVITGAFRGQRYATRLHRRAGPSSWISPRRRDPRLTTPRVRRRSRSSSPTFPVFLNASTCGLDLVAGRRRRRLPLALALAGITGTITISAHDAGVFPKTQTGACNTNANPVGYIDIGIGSGSISFR